MALNRELSLKLLLHSKVKDNEIKKIVYYTLTIESPYSDKAEAAPAWFNLISIYKVIEKTTQTNEITDILLNHKYKVDPLIYTYGWSYKYYGLIVVFNNNSRIEIGPIHESESDYYAIYFSSEKMEIKRAQIQGLSPLIFENMAALFQGEEKTYDGYDDFYNSILN